MKWLLLTLSLFVSMGAFAQQDRYQFDNNKQAILFEELTKELRCPKCQNQNIADSDAVVAKDLRDKVLVLRPTRYTRYFSTLGITCINCNCWLWFYCYSPTKSISKTNMEQRR